MLEEEFAKFHTAPKWQSWGLNSERLEPESGLLPHILYSLSNLWSSFLSPLILSTIFAT